MTRTTRDSVSEHERTEHIHVSRYWIVWALLLVGTVLTFVATKIPASGPVHLGIAMVIACAKSMLVVLFFMHLYDHGGASRLVFATSIFFIALLIGLTVLDNATRFPLVNPPAGEFVRRMPPGPDRLTPRALPEPTFPVPTRETVHRPEDYGPTSGAPAPGGDQGK